MRLKPLSTFKTKVLDPCTKLLSKCKLKLERPSISLRAPTFRRPRRRRIRPRVRARAVRFKESFAIRARSFPQCHPKANFGLRKRHPAAIRPKRQWRSKAKRPLPKVRIGQLLTVLFSLRKPKDVEVDSSDQAVVDVTGHCQESLPSPIMSINVGKIAIGEKDDGPHALESMEDACRNTAVEKGDGPHVLEGKEDTCKNATGRKDDGPHVLEGKEDTCKNAIGQKDDGPHALKGVEDTCKYAASEKDDGPYTLEVMEDASRIIAAGEKDDGPYTLEVMEDANRIIATGEKDDGPHTLEAMEDASRIIVVGEKDDGPHTCVEEACRRFENHLMTMIVEDEKLKDLMDVEELLYCLRNLKTPVFVNLVCRFYGEVCKDLFAPSQEFDTCEH